MMDRIERLARENEALRTEVERLKAQVHMLQTEYVRQNPFTDPQETIDELEEENERLKSKLRASDALAYGADKAAVDLRAEVERIKKNHGCARNQGTMQFFHEALDAHAEVERLRKALLKISTWRDDCRCYDEDMGHHPRYFDEQTVEQIEAFARETLGDEGE